MTTVGRDAKHYKINELVKNIQDSGLIHRTKKVTYLLQ